MSHVISTGVNPVKHIKCPAGAVTGSVTPTILVVTSDPLNVGSSVCLVYPSICLFCSFVYFFSLSVCWSVCLILLIWCSIIKLSYMTGSGLIF